MGLRAHAREHDYLRRVRAPTKGDVTEVPEPIEIAEKHDVTPAQVSLAWLLSKENVVAIPKSESEAHVRVELRGERIDAVDHEKRYVDLEEVPWN